MRTLIFVALLSSLSAGCAITQGRDRCGSLLDAAWKDLDLAKAQGFAGTLSYGKAFGLLTNAKTQQTLERYPSCIESAQNAQFYIAESRKGR